MIPIPIPRVDTEKKPDHVGEGLLQGLNKWSDQVSAGAHKLWRKPQEGHAKEGAVGAAKGVGVGLLGLAVGVGKGACDFVGSTIEGVRHTPDAVADVVDKDRKHNKHGVEGEGEGDLLETYVEAGEKEKEPEHLGTGLLQGVKAVGRGVAGGVQDLAMKPYEGAVEGGAKGFATGLGHGLLGFGTKTASGTLDLASSVVYGAKNTPDAIEKGIKSYSQPSPPNGSGTFGASSGARSSAASSSSGASGSAPQASGSFVAFEGKGQTLGY